MRKQSKLPMILLFAFATAFVAEIINMKSILIAIQDSATFLDVVVLSFGLMTPFVGMVVMLIQVLEQNND